MRRALPTLTLIALFFAGPAHATTDDERLAKYAPVYRLDRAERYPATAVPQERPRARVRVYGRAVRDRGRTYLQYWTYHAYNPQDRGVFRTGRHEGDWELVQLRLDAEGRPRAATYTQHSWAERCGWERVDKVGEAPVVYVANGSHAAYFEAGTHGRPFPDPDDEARGDGRTARLAVEPVTASSPGWMTFPGRWGDSEAGIVPGEHSSPRGPAFQRDKWDHPATLASDARACGSGAPARPWQWPLVALLVAAVGVAAALARRATRAARR